LDMEPVKTIIVVGGPTAVGKTSVAIELAKMFETVIISADSRQCYKELNIGVARPTEQQLAAVPHYFIASHSIHQKVTAATFEQYALAKSEGLFKEKDVVVMVGGTGLYIKAFCESIDEIPDVPEAIRNNIVENYYQFGLNWLQDELKLADPEFLKVGEIKNPHRMMRALEVVRSTGHSILSYRRGIKASRPFRVIKLALSLPKEALHSNINLRVEQMMEEGQLDEVLSLIPYQHVNALQTVGYKELFEYYKGQIALADAVELIKKNTRQYAKRQLTWFRKDLEYSWFSPLEVEKIKEHLTDALRRL
jgi:tRNA dimethylallyltransferase